MSRDTRDVRNMRLLNRTYYARLTIPSDRQEDVGKAMAAETGRKEEVVRTLGTRDYRTAVRTRDAALDILRTEIDRSLIAADLRPLPGAAHSATTPEGAPPWFAEAPRDRENRLRRSDEREWSDAVNEELPSDREGFDSDIWDRAEEIGEQHGSPAGRQYASVALGRASPIRLLDVPSSGDADGR